MCRLKNTALRKRNYQLNQFFAQKYAWVEKKCRKNYIKIIHQNSCSFETFFYKIIQYFLHGSFSGKYFDLNQKTIW